MAIRFILGRSGSGKTYHCLDAIRSRLRDDPVHGPRLILLVPEQAGLQMERAILSPPADKGAPSDAITAAHRVEVLSFQRLAHKLLDQAGDTQRESLTETARAMVLRHLLAQQHKRLRYYRRTDRLGGFVERLSSTVAELIREAVTPEDLATVCATDESTASDDPLQQAKLDDLADIYTAYLDYLGPHRLDPCHHLQIAREHLPQARWLHGAMLWVDGFASFTRQETLTLIELARQCQRVDITAMIDHRLIGAGVTRPGVRAALFAKTARSCADLREDFSQAGLDVVEPLRLTDRPAPRFRGSNALEQIESSLFALTKRNEAADAPPPLDVEIVELPSRRLEVEFAVARVHKWVRDPQAKLRYRDIAIIARDLTPYHDLLSAALTARDIPFFIDRRRSTAHHPLIELMRSLARLAAGPYAIEPIRLLLKTGLLPIPTTLLDELENYLLAHAITGFDAWHTKEWTFVSGASITDSQVKVTPEQARTLHRINTTRATIMTLVDPWLNAARTVPPSTGTEWATALRDAFGRLTVPETLAAWSSEAESEGDLDQAQEHRQVWRDLLAFLDDLSFAFDTVRLAPDELWDVLESGLAGFTLGLAPPMIDQLLVGSVDRSRHPDIRAAIVLGLNDGLFPPRISEDSILNDDDRDRFEQRGVRIGASARRQLLDESLLFYIAMTRASESLIVTYASADEDGKTLRPSPLVGALVDSCPGLKLDRVAEPRRARTAWDILSLRDLAGRLATEFHTRPTTQHDDSAARARWNELYTNVQAELMRDSALAHVMTSLGKGEAASLSPASIKRLIPSTLQTSVSRLESYATCPFQYFARYALRLAPREEANLAAMDVGLVHHAILENFVEHLVKDNGRLGDLGDEALLGALRESGRHVAETLPAEGSSTGARDAYIMRRAASHLARVLKAQRRSSRAGATRPLATELPFGFNIPTSLPALELSTPQGRRVRLRGFIDRVDVAELGDELLGIVIDYKRTRNKRLSLDGVYHGLSLQLIAYLLALSEHGHTLAGRKIRPIAALYVSLAPRLKLVEHPEQASESDPDVAGTELPRGLLDGDRFKALDEDETLGWSQHYVAYRKRDGSWGNLEKSDVAQPDGFRAALDHTRWKLGTLADGILDGNVAVSPYRLGTFSPCSWCAMASVCRFEMGLCDVRFLEKLRRSEVFRRMAESGRNNEANQA